MAATHSDETKGDAVRIALTSGLRRRQVASDLGVGLSTLGTWIRAVSADAKMPNRDTDLLRENERPRKESRILRDLSRIRKTVRAAVFPANVGSIKKTVPGRRPLARVRNGLGYHRWWKEVADRLLEGLTP